MPPSTAPTKSKVFVGGQYHVWKIVPDADDAKPADGRAFIDFNIPFGVLRRWVYAEPYDSLKQSGFQRSPSQDHINKIAKDMASDQFTPTQWTASADQWHVDKLVFDDVPKGCVQTVNLKVDLNHRLRLTDGNHRCMSLEKLLDEAVKSKDVKRQRMIEQAVVSLKVLLSPDQIHADFIRLQKGKTVPLNMLKALEMTGCMMKPEKLRRMQLATRVARLLHGDERSHLSYSIKFDTDPGTYPIQYSSLVSNHSSSLATTLYGGAEICLHFRQSAEWMVERYVDAYRILGDWKDDDGESILYAPSRKLWPTIRGGTRGGSHLLIGVGNALAWRLSFIGKDDIVIDPDEAEHLKHAGCRAFERGTSGGSATDKRVDMNAFCRVYFKDLKGVEMVDGVPVDLIMLTSPTTWGVAAPAFKAWKKKNPDYAPKAVEDGEPVAVEAEATAEEDES